MYIQKDIQDAIEKQLPAQVGEVLRTRLEQAEKDAATVKHNATTLAEFRSDIRKLESQVEARDAKLKQHGDIDKREAEVAQRERDLKITLLEAQLVTEKDKSAFVKEVALGLVRNAEFRRSVFENHNKNVPTMPGSYTQSGTESSNISTTESQA
jgi:hypothetical protein